MANSKRIPSEIHNAERDLQVNRFLLTVEEAVQKDLASFVFEPNDATTWAKIRSSVENFLYEQWRAGALQGTKPEEAFYVRVGLGQTMTALDVLEGRLIVAIGLATVRPAEFTLLSVTQKMNV